MPYKNNIHHQLETARLGSSHNLHEGSLRLYPRTDPKHDSSLEKYMPYKNNIHHQLETARLGSSHNLHEGSLRLYPRTDPKHDSSLEKTCRIKITFITSWKPQD